MFGLGKKKIKIYEKRGAKEEWKNVRTALKEAGIVKVKANSFQNEVGLIPCGGCPVDIRDFGPDGPTDRLTYNIYVYEEDAEKALEVLQRVLGVREES